MRADELAALPIRTLMQRNAGVDFAETTDVLMGAASGVGEQGYNVGRTPPCWPAWTTASRLHRQPLLRLLADGHPNGLARDPGRQGDQYIAAGVENSRGPGSAQG